MKHIIAILSLVAAGLAFAGCGGSDSNSVQTDHSAPAGTWGAEAAAVVTDDYSTVVGVNLTPAGGHIAFKCFQPIDFSQPLQPDSAGQFQMTVTAALGFAAPTPQPTLFAGTVTNHKMTFTLQQTGLNGAVYTYGPYTVTLGQAVPVFTGVCPG
jgi:hypothetical protein